MSDLGKFGLKSRLPLRVVLKTDQDVYPNARKRYAVRFIESDDSYTAIIRLWCKKCNSLLTLTRLMSR